MNNLGKIVMTLSLAFSFSAFSPNYAYSQTSLAAISSSTSTSVDVNKKQTKSIRPTGEPNLILDIRGHRKIILGIDLSMGAGIAELRENSLYIDLLSGSYQILFEQVNDSTFTEQLYTANMDTGKERHEKFTTIRKKNNSLVFAKYDTLAGTSRKEKIPLLNTVYDQKFMPVMTVVKKFLSNSLPDELNVIVMGGKYTFNLYTDKRTSNKNGEIDVTRYAKMTELVTRTPDDIIIMDDKVFMYTTETTEKVNGKYTNVMRPEKIEAKFAVINSGRFWNSENYKAAASVRKDK
jgi:hypothetical protein